MDSINYILLSQQMLDVIKHITDDNFQCTGAHALFMQHSPTAVALWNSFLLNHAPTAPSWVNWLQDLG